MLMLTLAVPALTLWALSLCVRPLPAQYHLNGGKPVATSIAATEHSVMTSWPNERQAIENMIEHFGGDGKVYAIVFDSYDYDNALNKVLPAVADKHKARGGTMVLRPDSGDPVECIISALRAGEKSFPVKKNMKGFKVRLDEPNSAA